MFLNLEDLNLRGNGIESMEGFNRIYTPLLEFLKIGYNNISVMADVRKAYWKKINGIELSINVPKKAENKINDFKTLFFLFPI